MSAAGEEVTDREGGGVPGASNRAGSSADLGEGDPAVDQEVGAVR